ncbi:MAG: DUF3348 domain-containing protein [Pseudoxanthomonas sp.]
MAKSNDRTSVPGPAFIRLLARLIEAQVTQPADALSDRLSQWISWTRAVALSRALDGTLPTAGIDATPPEEDVQEECLRVRASLAKAINNEPAAATTDYTVLRQRYVDRQRAMQSATGRLRGQLRDRLAKVSVDMARLAEVDAVMEATLSPREQSLLASVPTLLGAHYERLRLAQTQHDQPAATGQSSPFAPEAWLEIFRKDMHGVLLAELDVRFQPIEGLLAALRSHALGSHAQNYA